MRFLQQQEFFGLIIFNLWHLNSILDIARKMRQKRTLKNQPHFLQIYSTNGVWFPGLMIMKALPNRWSLVREEKLQIEVFVPS